MPDVIVTKMRLKLRPEQIELLLTRWKGAELSFKIKPEQTPGFLFKYSAINTNFLNAVKYHYLWLSRPIDFNDPFDSRILLGTNSPVDEIVDQIGLILESPVTKEDARKIFT